MRLEMQCANVHQQVRETPCYISRPFSNAPVVLPPAWHMELTEYCLLLLPSNGSAPVVLFSYSFSLSVAVAVYCISGVNNFSSGVKEKSSVS